MLIIVRSSIEVFLRKVVVAVLPRGVRLTRRLTDGTVMGGPNRAGYGGRGVFVFGETLEPELVLLDKLLDAGDVFVDVGANSGLYSLRAARLVGQHGTVLSLEPNPQMLAILDQNVRANGHRNVRARGLAAAESQQALKFYENRNMPNSYSLQPRGESTPSFSILTIALDSLLEWEGIDRVDVLKIDAEGVEDLVVSGAGKTVESNRPVIIAEVTRGGLQKIPDGYVAFKPSRSTSNNTVLVSTEDERRAIFDSSDWTEAQI